ncbi:hypothetical protein GCM10010236_59020 [Streptomyces eurythermus]|nr:hypothetical protein GCM10010236_59020 [Streptomyces eurythermus]
MTSSETASTTESTSAGAVRSQPSADTWARVQSLASFTPALTGNERAHPTALMDESSVMVSPPAADGFLSRLPRYAATQREPAVTSCAVQPSYGAPPCGVADNPVALACPARSGVSVAGD